MKFQSDFILDQKTLKYHSDVNGYDLTLIDLLILLNISHY